MFLAPVAAPGEGGTGGTPPPLEQKGYRAERMRIDCRKNLKFSLNFSKFFKIFLKPFKNFLKTFKIFY